MRWVAVGFVLTAAAFGCLLGAAHALQAGPAVHATDPVTVPSWAVYTLPPAKLARARSLYYWETALAFGSILWSLAILLVVLNARWAAAFAAWASRVSRRRWLQACCFGPLLLGVLALLHLPLAALGHHVSLTYGLSVQRWPSWMLDWAKALLIDVVVGTVVLLILFAIIRASRGWWLWFWLLSLPLQVLVVFLLPVVIDPMFDHFEPLAQTNPALVEELERVVARTPVHIPPARMFLMRASEKVTGLNAYVTGFGASKRVVVWDTTIRSAPTDEILVIFGHELGHYVLNHIRRGLIIGSALSLLGFYIGFRLNRLLIARYGERWHVRSEEDWAAAAVLLLVVTVLGFVSEPISNALSRLQEHQADTFGEEVVCGIVPDPQRVAATSFQRLGEQSLDYPHPNPFLVFWTYSHPSITQRMLFAARYDPCSAAHQSRFLQRGAAAAASTTR